MTRTLHALAVVTALAATLFCFSPAARADDPPKAPDAPAASAPPATDAPPAADAPPPAPPAPPVAEDEAKAKAHAEFDAGLALLKRRAFAEALTRFEASRAAFETRSATENIAVCLRELGRADEAFTYFELVIKEFPDLPADARQRIEKQLGEITQMTGFIRVEVPGGAPTVAVDGRVRTGDPLIRVLSGRHTVTLTRDGSVPKQLVVDVLPTSVHPVQAELAVLLEAGRIAITSDGAPADVFVDGVNAGKTPWEGAAAAGDHVVWLKGEGNLGTEPRRVRVALGQVTRETMRLEPLPAILTIDVVPIDARIALRGVDVGPGRFVGAVRAGPMTITFSKPGLRIEEREIDVPAGESSLMVALSTEPPASFALDFTLGAAISPGFGGLAAQCTACEAPAAFGVSIRSTFAYEFDFGLGVGASLGFTHLSHAIDDRRRSVDVIGAQPIDASADDTQAYDAFVAQAVGYFTFFRSVFPVTARVGAGMAFGGLGSERTLTVGDDATFLGRTISDENSSTLLAFVLTPGIRVALPLSEVVAIGLGCDVDLFFPIGEPDFDPRDFTLQSRTDGNPSAASVGREALVGSVIVVPTPLLYLRFAL